MEKPSPLEDYREHDCRQCGKPVKDRKEDDFTRMGFCDKICMKMQGKG